MTWIRRLLALVALAAVTACTSPVTVPVAPDANVPDCARIVLALPDELAGLERRQTSSQATRAWGEEAPVTLRCGVEPPAPTAETCTTADDLQGNAVDWIAIEGSDGWTFTTYGRVPAVEVFVPAAIADQRSTSFLLDLGPAMQRVEATRHCIGLTDF